MDATGTPGADDLATQFRRLQDDLKAIKETLAGLGQQTFDANHCAADAGKLAQDAKDEVHAMIAALEAYARKNPAYAVGGALGLGVVLGILLGRR
jgi:ElaB/YqjD/DUF883 family membrane-anchored ribosome-binding protein